MNEIRISAEQFRRELTELLSQAGYGGATVVVERHGTPLAALIPYQEYQRRETEQESALPLREFTVAYEAKTEAPAGGVLTTEEAAAHLRTSAEIVKAQAEAGEIPARKLGDSWRFSRAALEQWLQPQNSRSVLLAQAGLFAGDSSLDEILQELYALRGRPELDITDRQERPDERLM